MKKPDGSISHNPGPGKFQFIQQSILVIDDCLDMLALHRTILEQEGFIVFTAQSGAEAFEILSRIHQPDLILLDVQMEGMSGHEFLTLLEEKRPEIMNDVPVVFVTGADEVLKSKATGLIRKPIDLERFPASVHRFIEMGHRSP